MNNDTLAHFGIRGMRWGVRKKQDVSTPRKSFGEKRRERKEKKELEKKQRAWDKNANDNWLDPYNKAADYTNDVLIPKLSKKWKINKVSDDAIVEKYNEEVNVQFQKVFQRNLEELFGKRPE